jgi:hypothetical protein
MGTKRPARNQRQIANHQYPTRNTQLRKILYIYRSKKSFMTTISKKILGFLIVPAVIFAFTTKPDKANFSGVWKLNEGKSDLGQFANYAPRTIKVAQTADSITISKTAPGFSGDDVTTTETLSFDGKDTKSTIFGTSTRTASSKFSDDGQTLTITYDLMLDFNGQQTEIKGTEVWTLADSGKTLVSQNNSSSSFGDIQAKGIYEK